MNQNRPFFSTNTNLFDESFRSSAPTTFNGENVILSQEQQRRVFDTMNTSIVGNPFGYAMNQQNMLCAQKQYCPGGVIFTFPHSVMSPQHSMQGTCCRCYPMPVSNPPPTAANTFFPSAMDYQTTKAFGGTSYQQPPPREPFQLRFHHDRGTSCSDLLSHYSQVPASKGLPDLSNINGVLQCLQQTQDCSKSCQSYLQGLFPSPPIEFSSNAKKLVLSEPVAIAPGHVVDVLDENKKAECDKRKVSFSDPKLPPTEEKEAQITCACICDEKTCKNKPEPDKKQDEGDDVCAIDKPKKLKTKKEKKKKKEIQSDTSSETTQSSDNEIQDKKSKKSKKKRWWEHEKKAEVLDSDVTRSSDDEYSVLTDDKKPNKKRRNKKRKPKKESKDALEKESKDVLESDALSDSSNQSDSASEPSRSD